MKFIALLLSLVAACYSWRVPFNRYSSFRSFGKQLRQSKLYNNAEVVKESSGPLVTSEEDPPSKEETFKAYPFANLSLPVLIDCNNYWCGKLDDNIWHQNRDHVYAFIPVDESVSKLDVSVAFEHSTVIVNVDGKLVRQIVCPHPIVPSSSFWVLERDVNDRKYILLDLEKRVSYVNWMNLFDKKRPSGPAGSPAVDPEKAAMMQKLFASNPKLGEMFASSPQAVEEILKDPEVINSLPSLDELSERDYTEMIKNDGLQGPGEEEGEADEGKEVEIQ